jgi:predicted transcriptional regulator
LAPTSEVCTRTTVSQTFIVYRTHSIFNMKQRGSFSITALILLALQQKPLTKTRLMQTLILSYNRVGYYCDLLMHKGLIEYDMANHTYIITPRGTQILRLYQELAGHLGPVDHMIKKYSYYMQGSDYQEYRRSNINLDKPAVSYTQ